MTRTHCRSCGAEIFWAISASTGKRIPLDAEPVAGGNVTLDEENRVIGIVKGDVEGYVAHFATCPDAKAWRRR